MPLWVAFILGMACGMIGLTLSVFVLFRLADRRDRKRYEDWKRNHREMWRNQDEAIH